jgi:hypothetical protein
MASGTLLCRFGAPAGQPPATGFATPDVRNGLFVLDFDAVAAEYTHFVDVLPPTYGGGGLTVKLRWMASTAVSGTVRWWVTIERHQRGVDDSDADSFSAGVNVGTAAIAPCGTEMETVIVLPAGAAMDNLQVGERFRLRTFRDAAGTTGVDDMAGDAELVQVDVYET